MWKMDLDDLVMDSIDSSVFGLRRKPTRGRIRHSPLPISPLELPKFEISKTDRKIINLQPLLEHEQNETQTHQPNSDYYCHHRPRIKFKGSDFKNLRRKSSRKNSKASTANMPSDLFMYSRFKTLLSLRHLTPGPDFLSIALAIGTLVTLVVVTTTLSLPGACASSINSTKSVPINFINDKYSQYDSVSTSTLSDSALTTQYNINKNNNNEYHLNQIISERNLNGENAAISDNGDKYLNKFVSDSSLKAEGNFNSTSRTISTGGQINSYKGSEASRIEVEGVSDNIRPPSHFSDGVQNSGSTSPDARLEYDGNGLKADTLQADEPSKYVDNKNDEVLIKGSEQKISKSSKQRAKSIPQSDQHEQLHLKLGTSGSNTTKKITSTYPNSTQTQNRNDVNANNINLNSSIVGINFNLKPRRLESLSYGIKNRVPIPNSIHFADEEDEEISNSASSSSSGKVGVENLNSNKNNGVGVVGIGRLDGAKASGTALRRNPLQIRRDLSRLVASVGTGIDDDSNTISNKCDRLYISTPNGPSNGTFENPTLPMDEGNLYTCMLMFVARPNERVDISFLDFNLRGTPPECVHEWVDIWTEVEGTDPTDLITTPFSGRYCGRIIPRKRISLYGGIAIGFYSDKNSTEEPIFQGTYAFINESKYVAGTPVPRTLCSYTILGSSNKGTGELLSPTYPGVYPKNLSCSYKFIGTPGQRIRIEFRDFDVFYGGGHCPFDDVKIYDGQDPTSPLIGTYCGQQRNLVVYSSENTMLITFTTLDRNTDSQNRGFNGVYEFSNSFVKLDFIEKNMGDHIRGTECDQRILSKGQSSGVVYSPNYPFPYLPKIVCRYFIYGLQDPQNLERIRLSFEIFDVPSNINSAEDEVNQSDVKRCGDGFLKVYLKGQEVIQAFDKADYEFCGKEIPHSVVSDGPRMVLVFSSGETQGSGFKGKYVFETEYRVPGTEDPTVPCRFTYYSTSRLRGEFNSPRFPSNYPSGTNCSYIFYPDNPKEQVRIVFDNFKLRADKFNYTDRGAYGLSSCDEDWVEIWNVMSHQDDRLVGRYCGATAPGPIESREQAVALKVLMHTDDEGVYSGFKARYVFFTPTTMFGEDCGGNISQAINGALTSPKWPGKYEASTSKGADGSKTCNWYLTVRPGSRVMLHFQQFAIEGEPVGRGCPAAAVRIWEDLDGMPVELCGETLLIENSQYVSTRNTMRVTFITADKAVGAPGFRAIWTEVQDGAGGASCHQTYFRCTKSQFCIPPDLRCDGTRNCGISNGEPDTSDEDLCGIDIGDMNLVFSIGVGIAISLFLIIVLCAWGQRRKRRRRRRLQLRRPPIHVCDNAGARFAAMDSV